MKRILIINVNWLGDTLFATPFIRAIKDSHPASYIAVFTHPRCREILEGNPCIDELISYDGEGKQKSIIGKFSIVSDLRARRFDSAFILRRSLTRTMLLVLSGIPERIGYYNKKSGFLLTRKIPPPSGKIHRVDYFLGIAKGMNIEPKSLNYEFFISQEDERKGVGILKEAGIGAGQDFVVLNPGGNWDLKRWPPENFARLGDEIFKRFNHRIVLTGAEKDKGLCTKISGLMENRPFLLCGRTTLKTLGAVLKKAKKVVSGDSGPMHIAVAMKTPTVALFGPTSPDITGPYGDGVYRILQKEVDCEVPCYNLSCGDNRCMREIKVEDVLDSLCSLGQ